MEVLVAVSVLTVGFLGVVTLLARALSLNRVVSDSYTATYLAAEGIEVAKNILDGNVLQEREWNFGIQSGAYEVEHDSISLSVAALGRKLRYDTQTRIYGYSGDVETPFVRRVTVTPVGDGSTEIQVNATVSWVTRGGGSSNINLEDHFYNWR